MANDRIKNVLEGAAIQVIPKSASHMGCNYLVKQGVNCAEKVPWLYSSVGGLPLDDLLLDLLLPGVIAVAGIATKKQEVKDMAVGAGLTGLGTFLNVLLARTNVIAPWLPFSAENQQNARAEIMGSQPSGKNTWINDTNKTAIKDTQGILLV